MESRMKTGCLRLAFALAVALTPVAAGATPILAAVGATASVDFEGPVTYQNSSGFNFTGEGTIVSKSQTSLLAVLTAAYIQSDFDFAQGFRWTEVITNNSAVAWSQYSLELGSNGIFFADATFPTPTFATLSAGPTVTATS